jgi:hypothetical protein
MPHIVRSCVTAFLLVTLLACHRSGTWVDDPRNFRRAWGQEPPADVEVVHSWYWRSSHFTREEIYYFQLQAPVSYAEAFASENGLVPVGAEAITPYSFDQQKPAWFAPKPAAAYRIWSDRSRHPARYVLVDRQSGAIFIHAAQL